MPADPDWRPDLWLLSHLYGAALLVPLRDALARDDPALIHAANTFPRHEKGAPDCPIEGACLLAYPLWRRGHVTCPREADEAVTKMLFPQGHGLPPRFGKMLVRWDDGPRALVRLEFYYELNLILKNHPGGVPG